MPDPGTAPIANDAVRALPLVLDCRDQRMVEAVVNGTKHPLVRALLIELARPWPRPHYGDEREFQDRFLKRLQAAMPEANPHMRFKPGVARMLYLQACSDTVDSDVFKVKILWDGLWEDDGPGMAKHVSIEVVS